MSSVYEFDDWDHGYISGLMAAANLYYEIYGMNDHIFLKRIEEIIQDIDPSESLDY